MERLRGQVALVTGGSRGAGKGIAIELGLAGATVYVTGRSTTEHPSKSPGSLDEVVQEIKEAGGRAVAIRCDHTDDAQTKAAIQAIQDKEGKMDILVNNVWGGNELQIDNNKPMWEVPLEHWENMFTSGVRAQVATNTFAIPLMRATGNGLIVHTTFWDQDKYIGNFYYDLAKNALCRMAFGLASELQEDNVAAIAVSPGFMRTELVLKSVNTDEDHWMDVPDLQSTETPRYIGRGIVELACDERRMEKTGQVLTAGQLAKEYQFTDVDGRYIPPFTI
ncbi:SDR family NAD(P)-dependent oxidoreductase [Aureibacillus halotolerans]|uniref:NAD(P)-dependent dehydrogenase (Short-subunit alcohol dehydrogenase family) n=1 Tax=Aureibacillus halotolerans TaxID=1508390 RepID=A0A4R6U5I9_9BACI|nr:SDR family NAD(P)-dependent oxidoreductase [Aureibacillus halotolerans]TDQ40812.1 NAD(P)-dependent dehydrogenase (short-subunit alcohol dehydrogenase family) [Aureibacillus halotolerans]